MKHPCVTQNPNDSPVGVARRADALAVAIAMVLPTLVTLLYFVLLAGCSTGIQQVAYGFGKVVQFLLPVLWVVVVQRRRLRWRPATTAGLLEGVAFGAFVFAAMLVLYHAWLEPAGYMVVAGGQIGQKVAGFGVKSLAGYIAMGAFYSLGHSLLEEYYWRWFVFGQLRRLMPVWPAIAVSSVGFTLHHVLVLGTYFGWFSIATVVFSLCVAVGGAVWAWLYERSGSLVGPWLSHLLVDAAVFVIGYHMVRGLLGG